MEHNMNIISESFLLITIPKPYFGHVAIIQENALRSWLCLIPRNKIILFGDNHTVSAMAEHYGVSCVSTIECNDNGTPYLSSIFAQSCRLLNSAQFLVYVNADCILDGDLLETLQALHRYGYASRKFVASAQRCNIPLTTLMDFSAPDCGEKLGQLRTCGVIDSKNAMDIFICHPEVLENFPRFLVGRPGWDQWLVWYARTSGADVIDASSGFMVFHQSHDYTHVTGGWREACLGEEATYNRQLAAGNQMDLVEARTHLLMENGNLTTCMNAENVQHIGERALYYSERAVYCMETEDYLGALDYLDMLLVVGRDHVPCAQQLRAICFYKMGRLVEAKAAIINELAIGQVDNHVARLLALIAREMSLTY
jgi:hypothetical protein